MAASEINESVRGAITEIIHRYFWLADRGFADKIPALFARDGQLTFGPLAPKPGTLTVPEITAAMLARAKQPNVTTRHVVSNVVLRRGADETVEASCLLTLYRSDDESRDSYPRSIADVDDVFIRENHEWRIFRRSISPVFNRP